MANPPYVCGFGGMTHLITLVGYAGGLPTLRARFWLNDSPIRFGGLRRGLTHPTCAVLVE